MKIFERYLPRSLACLVIALPFAIFVSQAEPYFAPILSGSIVFIGCWKLLTPSASSKEGE